MPYPGFLLSLNNIIKLIKKGGKVMSDMVTGTFDTKQIHELTELTKLSGREEVLVDNGEVTMRVSVDTLLGYIRNQINGNSSAGTSTSTGGSGIHFLDVGEDLPAESRITDNFYIRAVSVTDAQIASGLPRTIKVSPNMQLQIVSD